MTQPIELFLAVEGFTNRTKDFWKYDFRFMDHKMINGIYHSIFKITFSTYEDEAEFLLSFNKDHALLLTESQYWNLT